MGKGKGRREKYAFRRGRLYMSVILKTFARGRYSLSVMLFGRAHMLHAGSTIINNK